VSGMTQSKGTEAISVLMKLVRPSNKLEGTNASINQYNFFWRVNSGTSSSEATVFAVES